jgi:two-component system, OmpR family, response regulator CpxR
MPSLKILIVNDDKGCCVLFKLMLERAGHRALFVHSGPAALDFLSADRTDLPDLILMDTNMPGMDGVTCIRRIRADQRLAHLPVVMAALWRDDVDLSGLGVLDWIPLPILHTDLVGRINGLFANRGMVM